MLSSCCKRTVFLPFERSEQCCQNLLIGVDQIVIVLHHFSLLFGVVPLSFCENWILLLKEEHVLSDVKPFLKPPLFSMAVYKTFFFPPSVQGIAQPEAGRSTGGTISISIFVTSKLIVLLYRSSRAGLRATVQIDVGNELNCSQQLVCSLASARVIQAK